MPSDLEASGLYPAVAAVGGLGGGIYGWLYRRQHPEIPANVAENARRLRERADRNRLIMQRNAERIAATKIVVRPVGQ